MLELPIPSWLFWALLSAVFAALTAIFAKVGVESINSDLATFLRTLVVVGVLGAILACPTSALVRQNWWLEEGRISGSS